MLLLKPAEIDVDDLHGMVNSFAPTLSTVEPAGTIAVWMTWERADE